MGNIKLSSATTVTTVEPDRFFPIVSSDENEKISRSNLFSQIRDSVGAKFIYRTIDLLQAADLEADPDEPTYVRCEETGYALYKITSLAAQEGDIELANGTTATYQIDGSFIEFDTVADVALASLPNGMLVNTRGCLSVGDGGNATLLTTGTEPDIVDGYSGILLASGNWAVLQPVNGCVDIHQFGVDSNNVRFALVRADLYCQSTGMKLVGSGSATLSGIPILSAPQIDLSNFTIILEDDFGLTAGVIYEALPSAIDARANVQMRFDGNRDNQSTPVIAFRLQSCATPDSIFHIYGDNCNTLFNLFGNVERCEIHVKGVDTDIICLESGSSPDTNVIYISGGNYKQAYVKDSSTTSQVYFNCQTQDPTAGAYAIEINGGRGSFLTGEFRIINHGALICGEDSGFVATSADFIKLNLVVHSSLDGGVPVIDLRRSYRVEGVVSVVTCDPQPVFVGAVQSGDLDIVVQDCNYTGNLVRFGDQAALLAAVGKYSITVRGAQASAKTALIDRCSELDLYISGSALPVIISSTVTNSIVNISLPRAFVTQNVPVTHNGVIAAVNFRGRLLTSELLSYLTAVGVAGIARGSVAFNTNTNGANFFDGTVWKYVTTSTTLV